MKGILKHIIIILVIGLLANELKAQQVLEPEYTHVFTDRAVYITGESILFSGIIEGKSPKSKVVYTELITPIGDKINEGKQEIKDLHFSGEISIPENTLSGYYYLRSYTKWMRNGSPGDYAYVLLKIINPRSKKLLDVPDSLINKELIINDIADTIYQKESYHYGEKIYFERNTKNEKIACLSIIPNLTNSSRAQSNNQISNYTQLKFYPETRGLSLSGKLKTKNSKQAIAFHLVNLHILGEKDFISVLSDAEGHFHFALPKRFGTKELFIIAASYQQDEVVIQIDQDYCYQTIGLTVPEFFIQDKEKALILQMAQNQQVYTAFYQQDSLTETLPESKAFYGEAFKRLDIDFYVPFDSLEQYFTDIPSWVSVKTRKGKRYFQLIGQQGELKVYEPLVMVDWVPVDDADRILAIHPSNVKQIEVINTAYVHGDIIYGGIINVLTRNTDFGGLKFPESGMYLDFDFYTPNNSFNINYKNTCYWTPHISMDSNSNVMELPIPQQKGEYIIHLQGISRKGEYINEDKSFIVE